MFKKIVALLLVCVLALPACMGAFAATDEGFLAFVALGGDKEASGDWGWGVTGADVDGATVTNAYIKEGDTVRVGIEFATPVVYTWYCAPCIVTDGSVNTAANSIDATVKCFIDGEEVAIDFAAGDLSWAEGTGDYAENCFRLAGGYNEWGAHYIASPAGFTKIEYEITLNSCLPAGASEVVAYDGALDLWIALGGDKDASNDWGYNEASEGVVAVNETITAGETKTVSLTFPTPVLYTWYCAPVLSSVGSGIGANLASVDAEIVCKIDGQEVAIDFAAGDLAWAEGTGSVTPEDCVRLAGGYNEWGSQYIASPQNFTTIEYTVTLNAVNLAVPEEVVPFDVETALAGNYNAYVGVQSENWIFRNQYYDASYGRDADVTNDAGNHVFENLAYIDEAGTVLNKGGSFSDCLIDGDGTYTVSIDISDVPDVFANDTFYNQLFVSTELPYGLIAEGAVQITDVTTSFDGQGGKVFGEITERAVEGGDSTTDIVIFNTWTVGNETIPFTMATDRIDITFTVSGFGRESSFVAPSEEVETSDTDVEEPVVDETKGGVDMTTIIVIAAAAVVLAAAIVGICVSVAKKNKKNAAKEETAE